MSRIEIPSYDKTIVEKARKLGETGVNASIGDSWAQAGFYHRIWLIIQISITLPWFLIFIPILSKLGLGEFRDGQKNSKISQIAENVWQIAYWHNEFNNATIFRDPKTKNLLLYLAPPAQQHTFDEIAKLGKITAIVFTPAHDTYAYAWSLLFPDAAIYAPKGTVEGTGGVAVTQYLGDDAASLALLTQFGITDLKLAAYSRPPDLSVEFVSGENEKMIIVPCGFGNCECQLDRGPIGNRLWSLATVPLGFAGLRNFRMFALLFAQNDLSLMEKYRNDVVATKGVKRVAFQHGKPCGIIPFGKFTISKGLLPLTIQTAD